MFLMHLFVLFANNGMKQNSKATSTFNLCTMRNKLLQRKNKIKNNIYREAGTIVLKVSKSSNVLNAAF